MTITYHFVGIPCNDFGAQEPGTNDEIKTFCSTKYNVSFPLFDKVHVKGTVETHGPSGGAVFRLLPLSPYLPTIWKDWGVATDIVTPDAFLAVDETVVVATNLVFGEPLTLTTVGWGHAGIRAQGGTGHGIVAFDGKKAFRLKGVDHITTYEGAPVTDYTLSSQAGLNW